MPPKWIKVSSTKNASVDVLPRRSLTHVLTLMTALPPAYAFTRLRCCGCPCRPSAWVFLRRLAERPRSSHSAQEKEQHKETLAAEADKAFASFLAEISESYDVFRTVANHLATLGAQRLSFSSLRRSLTKTSHPPNRLPDGARAHRQHARLQQTQANR